MPLTFTTKCDQCKREVDTCPVELPPAPPPGWLSLQQSAQPSTLRYWLCSWHCLSLFARQAAASKAGDADEQAISRRRERDAAGDKALRAVHRAERAGEPAVAPENDLTKG